MIIKEVKNLKTIEKNNDSMNEEKVLESINEIKTELPNEEKDNTEAGSETMIEKSEEEFESINEIKAELPNEVEDNNESDNETMIKKESVNKFV